MEIQGISNAASYSATVQGGANWLPAGTSWEKILEQERTLAVKSGEIDVKSMFKTTALTLRRPENSIDVSNYRSVALNRPAPELEKIAPREITAPRTPIAFISPTQNSLPTIQTVSRQAPSANITTTESAVTVSNAKTANTSNPNEITLDSLTAREGMLDKAWIKFDEAKQSWQAKWSKPPMFHFGMLLKPALLQELQSGQSMVFISDGKVAKLARTPQGDLQMTREGETTSLNAGGINRLLSSGGINSDNVRLFVDDRGDLVLEANGAAGERLARHGS